MNDKEISFTAGAVEYKLALEEIEKAYLTGLHVEDLTCMLVIRHALKQAEDYSNRCTVTIKDNVRQLVGDPRVCEIIEIIRFRLFK